MELQIGGGVLRAAVGKAAQLAGGHGQGTGLPEGVLDADPNGLQWVVHLP